MTQSVTLAKIAAAHGIKGLVKIQPFCEDVSLLDRDEPFDTEKGALTLILKNPMGKYILAAIEGVTTREQAEALKGVELKTNTDALPDIEDEDSYYYHDLIGKTVQNTSGEEIGTINSVQDYGAGDLLEIRLKTGEAFLLPFTNEYVPSVEKSIIIQNYEDFLDQNQV